MTDEPKILNLGCGKDYRPGWINVDIDPRVKVDARADLKQFPWPWDNDSCSLVFMSHVLEHFPDTIRTLREIHRILIPGGRFCGQVPFGFSHTSFTNPDHQHYFLPESFRGACEQVDFVLIKAEPGVYRNQLRYRVRNLIPGPIRFVLSKFLLNMYDIIDFELRKAPLSNQS